MNVKTTIALVLLVAAGVGLFGLRYTPAPRADLGTLAIFTDELTPARLKSIVVLGDDGKPAVTLTKAGESWELPGRWPARTKEVDELVAAVGGLASRFEPLPAASDEALAGYGLDPAAKPVTVKATTDAGEHTLRFGQPATAADPFARPTYARLDERAEVVRLGPAVLGVLRRPLAVYQKRQLFPEVERARLADPSPFARGEAAVVALPAVKEIQWEGPAGPSGFPPAESKGGRESGTLTATDKPLPAPPADAPTTPPRVTDVQLADAWKLARPFEDRPEPEKLRALLSAVPELWAESFVADPKPLPEYGLDKPEYSLTVTTRAGATRRLLVGKVSSRTEKKGPPPPPPPFGAPPVPPEPPTIIEEKRFAKLDDNPQVFELKADRFKDLFVAPGGLRDPQLARFAPADVTEVEIAQGKTVVRLRKRDEDRPSDGTDAALWQVSETRPAPVPAVPADTAKVNTLLDKLASLRAAGADILDGKDPKAYGLAPEPDTRVTLTLRETPPSAEDRDPKEKEARPAKVTRQVVLLVGKADTEKEKLYVQVRGQARINVLDGSLAKDLKRDDGTIKPALAYRGKRRLDFSADDLARLALHADGLSVAFAQDKPGAWAMTEPAKADVDVAAVRRLAEDLGRLEAVEYLRDLPDDPRKPAEPDKVKDFLAEFGLDKPTVTADLTFRDPAKRPAISLLVGKQREGRPEFYARLDSDLSVFAVPQEFVDRLRRKPLTYLPAEPWSVPAERVEAIAIQKGDTAFTLKRTGENWQLTGPFEARADSFAVRPLVDQAAGLRVEKYEALLTGDPAKDAEALTKYGLDKPSWTLKLTVGGEKPAVGEPELLVGNAATEGARHARVAGRPGVFVLPAETTATLERGPLDYLDRQLLRLNPDDITKVETRGPEGDTVMAREGDAWKVEATPPFTADRVAVAGMLRGWASLTANRIAAYAPKPEQLKEFGLDAPTLTVTITLKPARPEDKPATHTLKLGGTAPDGGRFARLDDGPAVAVLPAPLAADLGRTALDFADRTLFKFDASKLTAIRREAGGAKLELAKQDDQWKLTQPAGKADATLAEELASSLAGLRAERIAALKADDAKKFGLDKPAAVVTLEFAGGDKPRTLTLGGVAKEGSDERYARVDGSDAVAVLPADLSQRLLGEPVTFRDRLLDRPGEADRVTITRGDRKATFAKVAGNWKLTEPTAAGAEQSGLDDLTGAFARLRADALVAEKPGNLAQYGLDKPEAEWRFYDGDKEKLHLLIGGTEKGGSRRYARRAGQDLVFLLSKRQSDLVMAEYRKRAVAGPLDAAQVNVLTVSTPEKTFVLRKEDGEWIAATDADRVADTGAINETLAALAGVRAERFVADKGADLKLYGLMPPQFKLIAQAKTGGKVVLEIGSAEGGGKRRYARSADDATGAVFVLSEADSAKLARGLDALTRPK